MPKLVDRMTALLGQRSDAPAVLKFHQEEGLAPPPDVFNRSLSYPIRHPTKHYEAQYAAQVRREGLYPPRRENGQYVAYLTGFELGPAFAESFADGVTTKLTEKEAAARALESRKNAYARFYLVHRANGHATTMLFDSDAPHELMHVRIAIEELDRADAETLERLVAAAPKPTPRARLTTAQLGPAAKEAFPATLERLAAIGDDEGFGDNVDLSVAANWETGGPRAWTGNPEAEEHFRVFGSDGSGGLLAFWLVEAGKPLAAQPIVFLESEGDLGVVARDLGDFLVLLGDGVGPYELVQYGSSSGEPLAAVRALASEIASTKGRRAIDVIRDANRSYPDFEAWMDALRR